VILVDTNILVAVANGRDNNHRVAVDLLETVPEELLVTSTVIAEVCYLLQERAGAPAETRFLRSFDAGELVLADLTLTDLRRMAQLTERYADLGWGELMPPSWPWQSAWESPASLPSTGGTFRWCDLPMFGSSLFYQPLPKGCRWLHRSQKRPFLLHD